ncbi:MAG: hypothetical protein KJO09_04970 [Gammaproteobacteria bacterium]|nr:hypothetical protein [Gammaproteobacteria bacterium]
MEWQFLVGLGAITSVVIGLVIYFGLKLNKAVLQQTPDMALPINITFSGSTLFAFVVGFWVLCVAVAKLHPASSFGSFVRTADGVGAVIVGSVLFAGVAAAVLEKLGWPIARRDDAPD